MLKETKKEFGITEKNIKFYEILVRDVRDRLGDDCRKGIKTDQFGNKIEVPIEIYPERLIVSYAVQTIDEISFHEELLDKMDVYNKYYSLLIQGTFVKCLARQYLLESGRCFSEIKEDGTIIGPNMEVRNALFDLFKIEHTEYIIRLRG